MAFAASVERLPLETEDDESAAIKVTRNDGRVDVWLVRLTPPVEGAGNAQLPLAQPVLAPVVTADGQYRLDGHLGFISQGLDSEIQVTVGPTAGHHIDQTASAGSIRSDAGDGVWEGMVTNVIREGGEA